MTDCDICERDEQVTFVGASQLRDAVFDHGFDPFALGLVRNRRGGASAFNDWKEQIVAMEIADWGLCQRCLEAITNLGLGEPGPIGVKRVKEFFQSRSTGLIRCPTCNSEFRENAIVCAQCRYNMLLAAKQVAEQSLEYFESPVRDTDGYCSDPQCPCAEVKIPRGTGYLYVAPKLVEYRRNFRTLHDLEQEIERMEQTTNYMVMLDPHLVSPILVCERGARRRALNLEIAAADARRWWESGLVPLRPSPAAGGGSKVDSTARQGKQLEHVAREKALITNLSPESAAPPQSMQEAISEGLCFVCGTKPADAAHPIVVSLKNENRFMDVRVPSCWECRIQETRSERRANGIGCAVSVLPIILGIVLGWPDFWWQLGLLGLGVGFFGGIFVQSFLCGRGKSCQHPEIKEMMEHGWDFNHLY